LWEAHRQHYGREHAPALVWQADTRTMNPNVSDDFIAAEYERDPASAAAEYGAQFRSDVESFVSREVVAACVAHRVYERPPRQGQNYFSFVDPSGGSNDSFTVAIAHKDADCLVLDAIREVKPPFSPENVCGEFAELVKSYGMKSVIGDRYGGEWPREGFAKFGIRYEQSARSKGDLYRDLLSLLNSRSVELLDNATLANQLVGLERRTARGGRDSIDHAAGTHDDVANAVAGALLAAFSMKKRRVLQGFYGYGGPVTWRDVATGEQIDPRTKEPIKQTCIRVVRIDRTM
jgi:hypothetical protein